MPLDPLGTLPRQLLRLIYPAQALSPSRSRSVSPVLQPIQTFPKESNLTAAEQMREQMRREMLSEMGDEDEDDGLVLGNRRTDEEDDSRALGAKAKEQGVEIEGGDTVDWESMVSGTKKVLSMDVSGVSVTRYRSDGTLV
jgi:hypothetical protein